jgi:hypothetical protein
MATAAAGTRERDRSTSDQEHTVTVEGPLSTGDASRGALPFVGRVKPDPQSRPQLFVVVDTEEEFDWSAPFSRANTSVSAMAHIGRAQSIFDKFDIQPTYVVDYPVASSAQGSERLREYLTDGRCSIGAHLHPWVTPPLTEDVNGRNSFTCNLAESLQLEKIRELSMTIESQFGIRPTIFKAGRYGLGTTTVRVLEQLGYEVDMSVTPRLDFTNIGGPSFTGFDTSPFFLTERLLEIPCTVDFAGWLRGAGTLLHRIASTDLMQKVRALGVLRRSGMLNRIMLSPEGNTFDELCELAAVLAAAGCRTFTLTFHSPSVVPGHTPYVRTLQDLERFLRDIERFCEFFLSNLDGIPMTPSTFRAHALAGRSLLS